MSKESIVSRLRDLRVQRGVSQDVVSEACDISRVALTRYENGSRVPRIEIASRLADYYGVSVDYLLGNDSQGQSVQSDPESPSTPEDKLTQEIMDELRGIPDDMQDNILAYIRFLKSHAKDGAIK